MLNSIEAQPWMDERGGYTGCNFSGVIKKKKIQARLRDEKRTKQPTEKMEISGCPSPC
jgi:hypothetical protein